MDTWVDYLLTNKLDALIIALGSLFGGRLFWPQIKAGVSRLTSGKASTVVADNPIDVDPDWLESDHRSALFAALCLLNDHADEIGDESAKAACKALMPSVMTACKPEPETDPSVLA